MTELIFSIFASLQVGKYAKYRISPNKRRASNKRLPLKNAASLNVAFNGIVTIFYYWLNQNAYASSMQTMKQWKYC